MKLKAKLCAFNFPALKTKQHNLIKNALMKKLNGIFSNLFLVFFRLRTTSLVGAYYLIPPKHVPLFYRTICYVIGHAVTGRSITHSHLSRYISLYVCACVSECARVCVCAYVLARRGCAQLCIATDFFFKIILVERLAMAD